MRKSIIGYSVEQVDEIIDSLQNQNDALASKITNLTNRLAEAESNTEDEEKLRKLNNRIQEMEEQLESDQKASKEAEEKIRELSFQNSELVRQIMELKNRDDKSAEISVGAICARAYADMEKMKYQISEEILDQINVYASTIEESNNRMRESLNNVDKIYNDMLNTLAENLEEIFKNLSAVETGKAEIEKGLLPSNRIAEALRSKVKESVERANRVPRQEGTAPAASFLAFQEPAKADFVSERNPLDLIKEQYFKRAAEGTGANSLPTGYPYGNKPVDSDQLKRGEEMDLPKRIVGLRTYLSEEEKYRANIKTV